MNDELAHVEFYFPDGRYKSREMLVKAILNAMQQKGSISYSGYSDKNFLSRGLFEHIGDGDIGRYRTITKNEENLIRGGILLKPFIDLIKNCQFPQKILFSFILICQLKKMRYFKELWLSLFIVASSMCL